MYWNDVFSANKTFTHKEIIGRLKLEKDANFSNLYDDLSNMDFSDAEQPNLANDGNKFTLNIP